MVLLWGDVVVVVVAVALASRVVVDVVGAAVVNSDVVLLVARCLFSVLMSWARLLLLLASSLVWKC